MPGSTGFIRPVIVPLPVEFGNQMKKEKSMEGFRLTTKQIETIKNAAKKLTGADRWEFQAVVVRSEVRPRTVRMESRSIWKGFAKKEISKCKILCKYYGIVNSDKRMITDWESRKRLKKLYPLTHDHDDHLQFEKK